MLVLDLAAIAAIAALITACSVLTWAIRRKP